MYNFVLILSFNFVENLYLLIYQQRENNLQLTLFTLFILIYS